MSKKIGITGGIGAGKSIVCELLTTLGYPVFNSDSEAKILMNTVLKSDIQKLFGEKAYLKNELNRTYISELIFNDKPLLSQLNGIVHPAVREAFDKFSAESTSSLVFNEAAILFETGAYKYFDAVVLVTASEKTRIKRVMDRDGVTETQVKERMANQWTDKQKGELTTFRIQNDNDKLILPQTLTVINQLTSS